MGYDLVYIDFFNATDDIRRNAYLVEKIIEEINDDKVGNEKNVIMGISMGGLVARYALRHMETSLKTHETELYISVDSPHQGANVPLAYHAMVRHLYGLTFTVPILQIGGINVRIADYAEDFELVDEMWDLLNSPAPSKC